MFIEEQTSGVASSLQLTERYFKEEHTMPTYQYRCRKCGYEQEVFQRMSDDTLTKCTKCGAEEFERVISAEGGFMLKGSGFYKTDYNKSSCESASSGSCSTGNCPLAQ